MRPYLRVANVFDNRIDLTDVMSMNFAPAEFERFRLRAGDVLLNEGQSRHLVGRPAIFRGELADACFTNSLVRFRAGPRVVPDFALYVFRHYLYSGRFTAIAKWTTNIAHLGAERFADLTMPVPPIDVQRRIVAKLDELLTKCRVAREQLEAVPALVEQYRQSVLAAAFRGELTADWRKKNPNVEPASKLLERIRCERRNAWEATELAKMKAKGKLPKDDNWKSNFVMPKTTAVQDASTPPIGWARICVADLLIEPLVNGVSIRGSDQPPGVKSLRLNAIGDGGFGYDIVRYLPLNWEDVADLEVHAGDFFVTRGNGSLHLVGRGVVAQPGPSQIIFPDTMIRLRAHSLVSRKWLWSVWSSPQVRQQITSRVKTTAGIYKISQPQIASIVVPLPPVDEQAAIAEAIQRQLDGIAELTRVGSSDLIPLERTLLAKAFRGELVT